MGAATDGKGWGEEYIKKIAWMCITVKDYY